MADIKEIISLMNEPSAADQELIAKAYAFAEKAHREQKRFSGEPYFNHCFETAKILAELGMGPASIATGLLHDTIEDANVPPSLLERKFSKEILFLVDGVSKLGKLRYRGAERHIESLRKLFIAMSQDLRVLIIKLADRLHNMRTLEYVPKEKRARIAVETLEIYAPLAYRLSMRKLNRELENLAFPYVYPKEYEIVKNLLREKEKNMSERLLKFSKSFKKAMAKAGVIDIHTDSRIKSLYSLYKKLLRKDMDIEKIYDISAIRVIVPTVADCYRVLGIVHGIWQPLPGRIKDYIAFEKPNGYKSIHTTIFTGDGGIVEIQIRTSEMHREAEFGIASHLSFKEGKKSAGFGLLWLKQYIPFMGGDNKKEAVDGELGSEVPRWIKEIAEAQSETFEQGDFLDTLKTDFFQYRVFVFTPKGDVVDLPIDSSPIDFAFAIHTDIGQHAAGTRVNGKFMSLDTKLQNGDIIEIITKESAHPSTKWLSFAKTSFARKKIKDAIESKPSLHR